jgi:hypothetical protein
MKPPDTSKLLSESSYFRRARCGRVTSWSWEFGTIVVQPGRLRYGLLEFLPR